MTARGILVYEPDNLDRNRFFIERWMDAANRRGVLLSLVTTDRLSWGVKDNKPFLDWPHSHHVEFAVMRTARPLLSLHLEGMGIAVFNSARLSALANDKRRTHMHFCAQVPMMDTAFVEKDSFVQPFLCPVVVKAAHSAGGRGVFLAQDDAKYRQALETIWPDAAVVQPLCDEPGQDLRFYSMGERCIAVMHRRAQGGDFRSNVGQGAASEPFEPDEQTRQMAALIAEQAQGDLIGIDFIRHQGRWVFNEIEDAVGTRMLYQHTQLDAAADYLDHVLQVLDRRQLYAGQAIRYTLNQQVCDFDDT